MLKIEGKKGKQIEQKTGINEEWNVLKEEKIMTKEMW